MFNSYVGLPEGSKAIEEKGEHFLDRSVTTWSIALGSADTGEAQRVKVKKRSWNRTTKAVTRALTHTHG